MNQPAIIARNLTRDFKTVRAVSQLNLEIPSGIVFGFLGPNGSGKTTTIRLLLGLLEPTEGEAQVFGLDTRTQAGAIREQTGALLEHTGLYERLSAEENLDYYARIYHLAPAERKARVQEMLEHIGLWERRKEVVTNWSRGMKQKLAIARALIHRPRLVFLDEPSAGLDPVAAAAVREDIERLARENQATVFLTTHNLPEAERLCQQVAVIQKGRLLTVGKPEELRNRNGNERVEVYGRGFTPELLTNLRVRPEILSLHQENDHLVIELRQGSGMDQVIAMMIAGNASLEEVRKEKASLEDIFLELVNEEKEGGIQ